LKFKDVVSQILKDKKRLSAIVLLFAVGLLLLAMSSISSDKEASEVKEISLAEYKERLEGELEDACSRIEGVGSCRVIVTFERGAENTYKSGVLVESKPPTVMGVTVICRGADSASVRTAITGMMTSLFDIGANRVAVMKLKS